MCSALISGADDSLLASPFEAKMLSEARKLVAVYEAREFSVRTLSRAIDSPLAMPAAAAGGTGDALRIVRLLNVRAPLVWKSSFEPSPLSVTWPSPARETAPLKEK